MNLPAELALIDLLAGCDPWRSIPRLEAMWPADARPSWREAYGMAMERHPDDIDRRVAMLEGALIVVRAHARGPVPA